MLTNREQEHVDKWTEKFAFMDTPPSYETCVKMAGIFPIDGIDYHSAFYLLPKGIKNAKPYIFADYDDEVFDGEQWTSEYEITVIPTHGMIIDAIIDYCYKLRISEYSVKSHSIHFEYNDNSYMIEGKFILDIYIEFLIKLHELWSCNNGE